MAKRRIAEKKAVQNAISWILEANSEHHIREALAKLHPKSDPTLTIEKAVKEITAIGKEDPDFIHGWAMAATRELARKMISVGDFANALRAIKQASSLAGKPS